jgi:hypothetical protein
MTIETILNSDMSVANITDCATSSCPNGPGGLGGGSASLLCMGWNLVAHGRLSACLNGEYLHPGTYVSAAQRDAVGVAQNLEGDVIRWCTAKRLFGIL